MSTEHLTEAIPKKSPTRAKIGIGLFVLFTAVVSVLLAGQLRAVAAWSQRGLREELICLAIVRLFFMTGILLCGGFLLTSFLFLWGKRVRPAAFVLLAMSICSFGVSATEEGRRHAQIRNDLKQLGKSLEEDERQQPQAEPDKHPEQEPVP